MISDSEPISRITHTMDGKSKILDVISATFVTQHTINGVPNKADEEDLALMTMAIYEVIKRHSYVSLQELKYVFSQGLTGEYGENTHFFNAKNVNTWLRVYQENRRKIVKDLSQKKHQEDEQREVSEEEKRAIRIDLVKWFLDWIDVQRERYHEARGGGQKFSFYDIQDHYSGAYWYDRFTAEGIMDPPSKEEKIEVFAAYEKKSVSAHSRRRKSAGPININSPQVSQTAVNMAKFHFVKKLLYMWFENDLNYHVLLTETLNN